VGAAPSKEGAALASDDGAPTLLVVPMGRPTRLPNMTWRRRRNPIRIDIKERSVRRIGGIAVLRCMVRGFPDRSRGSAGGRVQNDRDGKSNPGLVEHGYLHLLREVMFGPRICGRGRAPSWAVGGIDFLHVDVRKGPRRSRTRRAKEDGGGNAVVASSFSWRAPAYAGALALINERWIG
jgi:hypothetical protein